MATAHDLRSAIRKLVRSSIKITNVEGLSDRHVEHRIKRHNENVERVMALIDEVTTPDTRQNIDVLTPLSGLIGNGAESEYFSNYEDRYLR